MTAKLLLVRGACVDGIVYPAGSEITCSDELAGELISNLKAIPGDEPTRKRVRARKSPWTEAAPELQARRPAGWIGRR